MKILRLALALLPIATATWAEDLSFSQLQARTASMAQMADRNKDGLLDSTEQAALKQAFLTQGNEFERAAVQLEDKCRAAMPGADTTQPISLQQYMQTGEWGLRAVDANSDGVISTAEQASFLKNACKPVAPTAGNIQIMQEMMQQMQQQSGQ